MRSFIHVNFCILVLSSGELWRTDISRIPMEKDDCAVIIANEIHVSSRQGTNTFLPLRHSLHDLLSAL